MNMGLSRTRMRIAAIDLQSMIHKLWMKKTGKGSADRVFTNGSIIIFLFSIAISCKFLHCIHGLNERINTWPAITTLIIKLK